MSSENIVQGQGKLSELKQSDTGHDYMFLQCQNLGNGTVGCMLEVILGVLSGQHLKLTR